MKRVFADTFYFLALLDSKEKQHLQAVAFSRDPKLYIVTTEWVLIEFGDAYSDPRDRPDFVSMYRALTNDPQVKIVKSNTALLQRGVDLFERRRDKFWSLTDCTSFVVMREERITKALTGDQHFEQAGYIALLR